MLRRVGCVCALLAFAACSDQKINGSAMRVVVEYPDFVPGCLRVTAIDAREGGESASSELDHAALDGKTSVTIAVFTKSGWSNQLNGRVEAFEGACSGDPIEAHATEAPVLLDTGVKEWRVTLAAHDGDHDGYAAAAPADGVSGTDCNDDSAAIHPGATESCTPSEDTDCDGKKGCADEDCQQPAASCDDLDDCTVTDVCQTDGGCAGTPKTCDTPSAEGCHLPLGTCVAGACSYSLVDAGTPCPFMNDAGVCTNLGTCGPPDTEFDCSDGISNDSDNKIDCDDPDCVASQGACDTGDPCEINGRCVSLGTCTGVPKCTATGCFTATCTNGVCGQVPNPGAMCDDALACTTGDSCLADGGCGGADTCVTNTPCFKPMGMCQSGNVCAFTVDTGAACDDTNAMTASDVCQADGGCAGTAYSCAAPTTPCLTGPVYQGDGGCAYPPSGVVTCTTSSSMPGFCLGDGGCAPTGGWPYLPSNFIPANVTAPTAAATVNCPATYDTTNKTFINTCTFPVSETDVTLPDGQPAILLATQDLHVTSSGSITLISTFSFTVPHKPVILAVFGNATLDGPVLANSQRGINGRTGPGAGYVNCGSSDGTAGGTATNGGGGGGAGFGTAGANGADGGTSGGAGAAGGIAGLMEALSPEPLRGGCNGGRGGNIGNGEGGEGGGALQLSASGVLTVNATVSASGTGGNPGHANSSGGGGGGSGGMLLLEGNTVTLTSNAQLTANGGGGGGGSHGSTTAATRGEDGYTTSAAAADGGVGEGGGGNGGAGGSAQAAPVSPAASTRGGGGGGGAVGYIYVRTGNTATGSCTKNASVESPAPDYSKCP